MRYILNRSQAEKAIDKMLERTGMHIDTYVEQRAEGIFHSIKRESITIKGGDALIVCGSGLAGAEGAAAARLFECAGMNVIISFVLSDDDKQKRYSDIMKYQLHLAQLSGCIVSDEDIDHFTGMKFNLTVDAIYDPDCDHGSKIFGECHKAAEVIRSLKGYKVSVDVPFGIGADDGNICDPGVVRYDMTIARSFGVPGQYLYPGCSYCGKISHISVFMAWYDDYRDEADLAIPDNDDVCGKDRDEGGNKCTFGRLLIIAGHKNVCGAAILSCRSAYRSGCGMVRLFTTESNRVIIQESVPEAVLSTYPDEGSAVNGSSDDTELESCIRWADRILIGPGIGTDMPAVSLVRRIASVEDRPVVFDADALNIISSHRDIRQVISENKNDHIIMTPHMGELARLMGSTVCDVRADWTENVRKLSSELGAVIISKDARTLIASPGRHLVFLNVRGNSGLATAGSGDVLAGITGALASCDECAERSSVRAVLMHADAGERASAMIGEKAVMAGNIIEHIN